MKQTLESLDIDTNVMFDSDCPISGLYCGFSFYCKSFLFRKWDSMGLYAGDKTKYMRHRGVRVFGFEIRTWKLYDVPKELQKEMLIVHKEFLKD